MHRTRTPPFRNFASGLSVGPTLLVVVAGIVGVGATSSHARPPSLADALPEESVAAYVYAGPESEGTTAAAWSTFSIAEFLLDQAREVGLLQGLNPRTLGWIDALTAVSEVCSFPHALTVTQISVRSRQDGGYELAGLRAALVIHTRGEDAALEQRIQQLLNRYTNSDESELSRASQSGGAVFRLRDRRLPDWAVIEWARVGEFYVAAIGEGALESMRDRLTDHSAGHDHPDWFRSAIKESGPERVSFAGVLNFDRLRRLADSAFAAKVEFIQYELGLAGARTAALTVGRAGKAVQVNVVARRNGEDQVRRLAGGDLPEAWPTPVIPAGADRYTALNLKPQTIYHGIRNILLASKSAKNRQRMIAALQQFDERTGVPLDELLGRLEGPVVIHNFPKPMLSFPLACTIVARINGDAASFRTALDRFLTGAREQLPPGSAVSWEKDPDGVWYLRVGVAGPAVTVAGSWLVVSFSPQAARDNAALLTDSPPDHLARKRTDR